MAEIEFGTIRAAIEIVKQRQGHPQPTEWQINTVTALVKQNNYVNQLPTGSGKTWPLISLPSILDVLRDNFKENIPSETRVLYIVPLVNIFHSLSMEMASLKIPFQILSSGSDYQIQSHTKIVCLSPEKLLNKRVLASILKLPWSAVSIDEPHLALIWGLSKTKFSKPFREAFAKLNSLNSLGVCFEVHSATIQNIEKLFKFLGRKDSVWLRQLELPERSNLTYFLFSGNQAPRNILQLPSVKSALHGNAQSQLGITLIYVQRISDGANMQLSLLEYCDNNGLLSGDTKPVAFLHSKLTEEKKTMILENAVKLKIRVLIATSAAGTGINLPVLQFVGWGLDGDTTGVVQSQGRAARSPIRSEGVVIWVHRPKEHGQRVSSLSKVRELLSSPCLRETMNSWFDHKSALVKVAKPEPEFCCSSCMKLCIMKNDCKSCISKIELFEPKGGFNEKDFVLKLTDFLRTLNINEESSELTPVYDERSIGKVIISFSRLKIVFSALEVSKQLQANDNVDLEEFLMIFSLGDDLNKEIFKFVSEGTSAFSKQFSGVESFEATGSEDTDAGSDSSESEESLGDLTDEYYDSEEA